MFNEWVRSTTDNARTQDFYADCYRTLSEFSPLGNLRLDRITEEVIEAFKLWALKEHSRTTVNRYLAPLRKALRYACHKRHLTRTVPVISLYPNERRREYTFTDSEYQHWLEVAPEPTRSASILAYESGITRGELLALRKDCVLPRHTAKGGVWGTLQVRRGLKRSSRKRDLPITQAMAVVLARLLDESKCDYVFVSPVDAEIPLSENCLQSQHRAMKGTGEFHDDAGLHALRHTFLTEAARNSPNVAALQKIAGHANIATTMRYVHPEQDDLVSIALGVQRHREERVLQEQAQVPTKLPTAAGNHLVQ